MIIEFLQVASSLSLGLLVGSLLTEAMILVPYWRTMTPKEFLRLHGSLGPKLYSYFAPLTIIASVFPILAAITPVINGASIISLSTIPALITLVMLGIYQVYFKGANESFKTGSVGVNGVPEELARWAAWHAIRVCLGLVAFLVSLLVIL